jgi:hypothetical protein
MADNVPGTPKDAVAEGIAAEAMAHFFLGLMKADGQITPAEEQRMRHFSISYKEELPCELGPVLAHINYLRKDPTYDKWLPAEHIDTGMVLLDKFIAMRGFMRSYITNLMDMLEELMQEDGVDENEAIYLKRMESGLTQRFIKLVKREEGGS